MAVNLNKPIIPLLMEKTDWPPKGSMGPIFSEYLFIRFFQRGSEETQAQDKRYWPVPKFQELLMQLNYYVVPDQKMVQKGEHLAVMSEEMLFIKVTKRSADRLQMTETLRHCTHILIEGSTCTH